MSTQLHCPFFTDNELDFTLDSGYSIVTDVRFIHPWLSHFVILYWQFLNQTETYNVCITVILSSRPGFWKAEVGTKVAEP
jgi:hypothetical protein